MIKSILKKHNIVATKQRIDIISCLHNHQGYLSASDLSLMLNHLDVSTIYRTLNLFEEHKLVTKKFDDEVNGFTYKFVQHTHVHHLRCLGCDKVFDIDFCPMNVFDDRIVKENQFKITDYTFEVYGYCVDCAQ